MENGRNRIQFDVDALKENELKTRKKGYDPYVKDDNDPIPNGMKRDEPLTMGFTIKDVAAEMLKQVFEDPETFKTLYRMMKPHFQRDELKFKTSYNYTEIQQIIGAKSRQTVKNRVKQDNYLKAYGRDTNEPFILKDDLYQHLVLDMGMERNKAFRLLF